MAYHKGRFVFESNTGEQSASGLTQVISTKASKITWGEPAQITQAKLDKACPRCGAHSGDENDFRFDMNTENGIFIAKCHNCGWSC